MKKHVLIGILCTASYLLTAQQAVNTGIGIDTTIYKICDLGPMFPGCEEMERNAHERLVCCSELLHKYIYDNLKYPEIAKQNKSQGIVVVNFVVEADGSVSNCKAANFISHECNKEAVRLAQSMPAWMPAERNGAKVRSEGSLAVRFKLLQDGAVYRPPFVAPKERVDVKASALSENRQPNIADLSKKKTIEEPVYKVVEQKPEYPGGETAMLKFIYENLKYPQKALDENIEGTVYIRFVIEKDGNVSNIEIIKDIGGGCGEEAVRVVNQMPLWEPGRQRGTAVNVYFNLPVRFKLDK